MGRTSRFDFLNQFIAAVVTEKPHSAALAAKVTGTWAVPMSGGPPIRVLSYLRVNPSVLRSSAFRSAKTVEGVLRGIPSFVDHIVVVDDASDDETGEVVSAMSEKSERVTLLRHDVNRGVGGATLTGFGRLLEVGVHIAFKIDAD